MVISTGAAPPAVPASRPRVVSAACAGNLLEWYDFAVYGALAGVLAHVFFPATTDGTGLLAVFAVYATAFVTRPVGALVFGRLGDLRDRHVVLAAVVGLMTAASAGIGLLPGYAAVGLLAPVALVLLRAVQGLAAGGELGVSAVFLVEQAPDGRRGLYGAWHTATMCLGTALAATTGAALTAALDRGHLGEGWWRAAFLAALPLGLVAVYLRRSIPAQERPAVAARPVPRRRYRAAVVIGFTQVAAPILGFNLFFVFVPNRIAADHTLPPVAALACAVAGLLTVVIASPVAGLVSDRVGRRRVLLPGAVAMLLLALPLLLLATSGSLVGLAVAEVTAGLLVAGTLSVAMVAEAFPQAIRARALAVTAGLASALIGGTAPFIAQFSALATGSLVLPGVYLTAVAAAAAIATAATPETAFARFDTTGS